MWLYDMKDNLVSFGYVTPLSSENPHNDPHLNARGFVKTVEHPKLGPVKLLGWPARMSASEVEIEAAPFLGFHTADVLGAELGLSTEEIAELREQGAIGAERAG